MNEREPTHWWQSGVIYQVYLRSFMDSDGDGVGDLKGLRSRLDYLQWLGVDALWLTPFYPSPMCDWGYDITDHTAIDPVYGTLADFDELLAEIHRRGIKLIIDFVPNHTSDQHPWFLESRSSRTSPKRDWYIWRDPRDGGPPSNWLSGFGGNSWKFDERTQQYYFHACMPEQPDLNWRNPDVREAMYGVMRFWLDRGVDGFRVDAADRLLEDERLRDDPPNPAYTPGLPPDKRQTPAYSRNQPESRGAFSEMGAVCSEYGDKLLIGEVHVPTGQLNAFYSSDENKIDVPFNFSLLATPWEAIPLRSAIDMYVALLEPSDWPNWVLGNHDTSRVASRIGRAQARVAAVLLLTLRGTPVMYYGDELGMLDVPIPPEEIKDPHGQRVPGHSLGRDPERTPMQWDGTPNAGFTEGTPWLPVSKDADRVNVADQHRDPTSILNLYRSLLKLRTQEPVLVLGEYAPVESPAGTLAYLRMRDEKQILIAANLTGEPLSWDLPARLAVGRFLLSTDLDREGSLDGRLEFRANEAVVISLGK
jgi:alpha-glucosidase